MKRGKKSFMKRATSVVLSAAMLLTGGGFDHMSLPAAKAADGSVSVWYQDSCVFMDSGCTDSTFTDISLICGATASVGNASPDAHAKKIYLEVAKFSDGKAIVNGFRETPRSDAVTHDKGQAQYAAARFEKADGVYATEISIRYQNDKTVTIKDSNGDGYFTPSEFATASATGVTYDKNSSDVWVSRWSVEDKGVSLNANGGSCDTESVNLTVGKTITELPENLTRTGYEFGGWYNTTAGMGADGSVSDDMTKGSSRVKAGDTYSGDYTTLYAGWRPHVYSVVFLANGGSGSMNTQNVNYGEKTTLSANQYTRDGYTFDCWKDDNGQSYGDGFAIDNLSSDDGGKVNLYAQWKPGEYTITYNANGGTGNTDATTVKYQNGGTLATNGFAREGYDFDGWNTNANGTGTNYTNGQELAGWNTKGGAVLYAKWKPHEYTIHFDANGGSGAPSDMTNVLYDQFKNLNGTSGMKRGGYTFTGWNTQADSYGTSYSDGQSVSGLTSKDKDTVTLYAQWRPNRITLAFDPNGGQIAEGHTAEDAEQEAVCGRSNTLKTQDFFANMGYTFSGWNTKADGSGQGYGDGDGYTNATAADGETVTLYAQWRDITYNICYHMDSTPNAADGQTVLDITAIDKNREYDTKYTVRSYQDAAFGADKGVDTVAYKQYKFLGWSLKKDSAMADYLEGGTVTRLTSKQGDTVDLYAVWEQKPSYIKCYYRFEGEDGTYPMTTEADSYLVGKADGAVDYTKGIREGSSVPYGYTYDTCVYYKTSKEDDLAGVDLEADKKAHAEEVGYRYPIKFEDNNDNGLNEQHLVYRYKRVAHTVTLLNGSGVSDYSAANGEGKGFTALKDKDGKTIGQTVAVKYGESLLFKAEPGAGYVLDSTALDDAGGTVNGLVTNGNGSITNSTVFQIEKMPNYDITIRLQARPMKYNVQFNQNIAVLGASGVMESLKDLDYGTVYKNLLKCIFVIPGYEFDKWTIGIDGTGDSFSEDDSFDHVGNINEDGKTVRLYAQWKKKEYSIALYSEPSDALPTGKYYAKNDEGVYLHKNGNDEVKQVSVPYKEGYVFGGYYTEPGGSGGQKIDERGFITRALTDGLKSDIRLYAKWTPVKYKICFTENNEQVSGYMADIDMVYDEKVTLPLNVKTRQGYDFVGWSTLPSGQGDFIKDGATVSNLSFTSNEQVYLYAQWKAHDYTIHFNGNGIGSGIMGDYDMAAKYGKTYNLPLNTFKSRNSYLTFKGWNTDPNLDYAIYGNGAAVKNLTPYDGGKVTLYAIWGYDENAKFAVRTWQQKASTVRTVSDMIAQNDGKPGYEVDWGKIYNQEYYDVKDTELLASKDAQFTLPSYDGFTAGYQADPVSADGIIYYDFYYDRNQYNLTVNAGDGNISSVSGNGVYYYGEDVTVEAVLQEGKFFGGWDVVSGELTLKNSQKYNRKMTMAMPASNIALKANSSDVEIPIPSDDPDSSVASGSGVVKNLGETPVPNGGIEISATVDYRLVPEGVTLISASSSNPSVAYVDKDGNLILGKSGTAVITLETSAGKFVYTIHMTGVNGVLEAGDVRDHYIKSVIYYVKNGEILTIPSTEKVPVISSGTIIKSTSTDPDVAYVGEDGYLVFGKDGETIITTETSEGTIVYKVVIKDGKITIQNWKDENVSGPSAEPSASSPADGNNGQAAPSATQTPGVPAATNVPNVTNAPAATNVPATGTVKNPAGTTNTMTVGGLTYKAVNGKAQVTKAAKSLKKAAVKNKISIGGKTYTVTVIASNAFKNCKKLKSVTFKNSSLTISKNAFKGCKNLKNVSLSKAKTLKISKGAFTGCKKVTFKAAGKNRMKFKKVIKKSGLKKFTVK